MNKSLRRIVSNLYWYGYRRFVSRMGNRILIYHAFGSKISHDSYGISISPDRFRDHCDYIASNHQVIPITNTVFMQHFSVPTLSISIDDGYADTLTGADILVANNLPFSLYVTTDLISRPGYLTPDHLRQLGQIRQCIIGTHGKTHRRLGELSPGEQKVELTVSKDQLEQWLGSPVASLSYPHGSHSAITKTLVREAGYTVAGSSRFGVNCCPPPICCHSSAPRSLHRMILMNYAAK